jgi:muramoyltetrapeptide carboxypeptidase
MSSTARSLPPTKPERLRLGDVIGVIAPASPPPDPGVIDRSVVALERLGFKAKLAANVRQRHGFLAGSDEARAADLMAMFADPEVKAILCIRGGYGTARLLTLLDYGGIRSNPKVLIGYSDITTLHIALLTHANLVSFHGPMLNSELSSDTLPEFTVQSLLRTVMEPQPAGSIRAGYVGDTIQVLRGGTASGELIGGNLWVLCTTLGTPFQPDFRDKILFFEDVGEKPYRFDRMLTHLLNAGVLQQVAGVAVGINKDCDDPKAVDAGEYRQSLADVLAERLLPLEVPVVTGLPFGHQPWNATLPIGIKATLDGNNGDLIVTDAAVK